MLFLDSTPNVAPITNLILTWTYIGQALVGSIGALAFIFALRSASITLLSEPSLNPSLHWGKGPAWRRPVPSRSQ